MEQVCQEIGMPVEATEKLLSLQAALPDFPERQLLRREQDWEAGLSAVKRRLGEDLGGFKMLLSMLRCALDAWDDYQRLKLSRQVYRDTMACFSRFVREHQNTYGEYGFDREWWTVRQVSCRLFRIGALEYELTAQAGQPVISLHIPSDVRLLPPLLRDSYRDARRLLGAAFPKYQDKPMVCSSWLLSPALQGLLSADSHILQFQKSFQITPAPCPDDSFFTWVFQTDSRDLEALPERTALQRNLKAFLRNGGQFFNGYGVLMQDPFQ